mgnify:CR=1 FL=1
MSKYHTNQYLHVKSVTLLVKNIETMLSFYTKDLGLLLLEQDHNIYKLGVKNRLLVTLVHDEHALPKSRTTGLYHFALLLPSRAHLGQILKHFLTKQIRLTGASDHGVSEALYLNDPEGNGIEIYRDRQDVEWPKEVDGSTVMYTDMMDAASVLDEALQTPFTHMSDDTIMGHLHLHVGLLADAHLYFIDLLGFSKVLDYGDSALFISDKGYHHHIGLNTWNGKGIKNHQVNTLGLIAYDLNVPANYYDDIIKRLKSASYSVIEHEDHAVTTDLIDVKVTLQKGL